MVDRDPRVRTASLVLLRRTSQPRLLPDRRPDHRGRGDICGGGSGCPATSNLIFGRTDLDAVLLLGDNAYPCGSFASYLGSFDPYWGRFKALIHPSLGNHEYGTTKPGCDNLATGYFTYFGAAAQPNGTKGYYYFDVAGIGTSTAYWRIIMLNANCAKAKSGGCGASSPQVVFLQDAIGSAPSGSCIIAAWHQPLFSGSPGSPNTHLLPFWNVLYAEHAALVLNGHKHYYQRFAPQDPSGAPVSDGITEILAGTGGATLGKPTVPQPNSAFSDADHFGVLFLTLHATTYDWQFEATDGSVLDSGVDAPCTPRP